MEPRPSGYNWESFQVQEFEMLEKLFEGIPLGETEILFQGFLGADALYENFTDLAKKRC